ncbi:DesA family fatty acid desaturase [Rhodoferax aquaticus]|uniref:Acyl-CoA desaturase n=1 Tax=Rhodoferax aquaticus TaxID=2527691 RepID=A0A515ES98_9BURK|nr:fatty acid desaturase [Rhodoferax aquaticus]QDL55557.1 acyl-CoA desaturase [Rhodoferax aquaticus]
MQMTDWAIVNAAIEWFAHGMWDLAWWQIIAFTLVLTHITMISVTVFLHRHQAHRSLDLHPIASHFFRFWLWLTTGQVTKEWAAIHRKHHAKCEQAEDPHSPHVHGIKKVLLQGAELYRTESKNQDTLARFGHGTPNDWIEKNLYTRFSWQGVGLMLIIDLTLFGAAGLSVWAVQMAWTPIMAAGIINGAAHYWGYRNFEAPDASTNISPWGILIAGEELHNNHHTYPTSAKLSVKPYEFDIGWMYISLMQMVGLATVKKTPPKAAFGSIRRVADEKTLEALIANRYEIMATYAKGVREAAHTEFEAMKLRSADAAVIKAAKRWMHRDTEKVPATVVAYLAKARAASPVLDKMVTMREELRQMWLNTSVSREQLAHELQAWCHRAEESGISALRDFSLRLRAARV